MKNKEEMTLSEARASMTFEELVADLVEQIKFYHSLGVNHIEGVEELQGLIQAGALTHVETTWRNLAGEPVVGAPNEPAREEPAPSSADRSVELEPRQETMIGTTMAQESPSASLATEQSEASLLFALGSEPVNIFTHLPKNDSLPAIRDYLGDCQRCKLCFGRTSIVFGAGNPKAEFMLVGEGPGAEEDKQGLPFVGAAGQLLSKILASIGLTREEVYITNVIKCRPPNNRKPEPDEIASCEPFLMRQINTIRPKLVCALGGVAAQTLLKTKEPISKLRGRFMDFHGLKLIATFHPAYLLRNPQDKKLVWEDMQKIRDFLKAR